MCEMSFNRFNNVKYHSVVEPVEKPFPPNKFHFEVRVIAKTKTMFFRSARYLVGKSGE